MDRPDLEDVLYGVEKSVKELKSFPVQPLLVVLFQLGLNYNKKKT